MCLSTVNTTQKPSDDIPDMSMRGYQWMRKFTSENNDVVYLPLYATQEQRYANIGNTQQAQPRRLCANNYTKYPSGYHFFPKKQDAITYGTAILRYTNTGQRKAASLVLVQSIFYDVHTQGTQIVIDGHRAKNLSIPCYVAQWRTLKQECQRLSEEKLKNTK